MNGSAGVVKIESFKAGVYHRQFQYRCFVPEKINHGWTWEDPQINTLMERAIRALGQLDGYARIVPDVDLFIQMHVAKEASQSSRIEGTQTNIDDVVLEQEQVDPEKRDDWQEVQNYIEAMNGAIDALRELPLSNRLLQNTHATLLKGVRGRHKGPGEFRRSQNWIGGSGLSDAAFIPPSHELIPELMSDLEKFWHNQELEVPHLIRAGISHYQFETIHPFQDGNGRIGRLLITLYLIDKKFLWKPTLYLSDFFERHRSQYYDALDRVRSANDLAHWLKFFLNAVIETAESSHRTFERILKLRQEVDARVVTLGRRSANARRLVARLYQRPVLSVSDAQSLLKLSPAAANGLIRAMIRIGVLEEVTGFRRNRIFMFSKYLDVFRSPTDARDGVALCSK